MKMPLFRNVFAARPSRGSAGRLALPLDFSAIYTDMDHLGTGPSALAGVTLRPYIDTPTYPAYLGRFVKTVIGVAAPAEGE